MKLSNIIHSTSLSENNNDMFPGVASSVFDDAKAKDQPEKNMSNLAWVEEQFKQYSDIMRMYETKRNQMQFDMEKQGALNYLGSGTAPGPNEIMYTSFDWFDKYNVLGLNRYHAIAKSSPYLKDIENTVRIMHKQYQRETFYRNKSRKFVNARDKIEKQLRKGQKDAAGVAFDSHVKNVPKIPAPSPIPNKLPVKNKRPINNPYVTANATKQYAGNVFHYPHWSPYWKNQLMQVADMLKRNGKGELEMMYASTHDNGGARFNFVITGAKGNLTWRKYDPSPGAGQNWIFLNGKKMNTSTLLNMDKARQDRAAQSL